MCCQVTVPLNLSTASLVQFVIGEQIQTSNLLIIVGPSNTKQFYSSILFCQFYCELMINILCRLTLLIHLFIECDWMKLLETASCHVTQKNLLHFNMASRICTRPLTSARQLRPPEVIIRWQLLLSQLHLIRQSFHNVTSQRIFIWRHPHRALIGMIWK